jgi:hypothetical protein
VLGAANLFSRYLQKRWRPSGITHSLSRMVMLNQQTIVASVPPAGPPAWPRRRGRLHLSGGYEKHFTPGSGAVHAFCLSISAVPQVVIGGGSFSVNVRFPVSPPSVSFLIFHRPARS